MEEQIPAVPQYIGKHLAADNTPPGHRFALYFPVWKKDWSIDKKNKNEALRKVLDYGNDSLELLKKIRRRQDKTAEALGELVWSQSAVSTSPFVTGVGMEHPLENGFAFLSPYGLPYLPGSSVKGVLRKSAEDLALMEDDAARKGWDILTLWCFFGFDAAGAYLSKPPKLPDVDLVSEMAEERKQKYLAAALAIDAEKILKFMPEKEQKAYLADPHAFLSDLTSNKKLRESVSFRGALSFWDVFPEPTGKTLGVDIINPHHGKYYQDNKPPSDCESPTPNFFLVVPPKTGFVFHVYCQTNRLPDTLRDKWKSLIQTAFDYTFDWLGFGAKTAVGYGVLKWANLSTTLTNNGFKPKTQNHKMAHSSPEKQIWEQALLGWKPDSGTLLAKTVKGLRAEIRLGNDRTFISEEVIGRIRNKKPVKARVIVEPLGRSFRIINVEIL